IVAFGIKKKPKEQRIGHLNRCRFGGTHLSVKIKEGFFFGGGVVFLEGWLDLFEILTEHGLHVFDGRQAHNAQNLRGWKISAAVNIRQENVVQIIFDFKPGAARRDDPSVENAFSCRMELFLERNAWRTLDLGDNDSFVTVDDERAR